MGVVLPVSFFTAPRCRLLTAFVNVLPREAVLRVWDIMLFMRSPCVLFRVLLMVFESNIREILGCHDSLALWTLVVKMPSACTDTSHIVDGAMLRFTDVTSYASPLCMQSQAPYIYMC